MKAIDLSFKDKTEFMEDIRTALLKKDCSSQDIELVLYHLGRIFYEPIDHSRKGINVLSSRQQNELRDFIKEHRPGKNILATLLIFYFLDNRQNKIIVTQKFIEDVYSLSGLEGNIAQQLRDYGPKSKHTTYFIENEQGGYDMTNEGMEYISKYISISEE